MNSKILLILDLGEVYLLQFVEQFEVVKDLMISTILDVFFLFKENSKGTSFLLALAACSLPLFNYLLGLSYWCLHY